jgi:hypothetical protein
MSERRTLASAFRRTSLRAALVAAGAAMVISSGTTTIVAQGRGGRGGAAAPAGPARTTAPVDLTGTWVPVITEDWRYRMMTAPNGETGGVPMLPAARQAAMQWDRTKEGSCEAYGVGGLMRMPVRFKISWADDYTLKIESDGGQQTRLLHFAAAGQPAPSTAGQPRTLQGYSVAEWQRSGGALDAFGPGLAPEAGGRGAAPRWGSLRAVTTNVLPGWLTRNGVPYGQNLTLTEYYTRITHKEAGDWLVITTTYDDPQNLQRQWITSTNFQKEANDAKWSPAPCKS